VHLNSCAEAGPRGRVFVGAKGATLRRGNFQPMWAKALKQAGLPRGFHFHDLRHTGNTGAAGSGANLRELMDRMGHSSMRAALIYLHANRGASKAIAAGIDRQLAEAAETQAAKPAEDGDASGTWLARQRRSRSVARRGSSAKRAPDQDRNRGERVTGIEPA
jgi:site-specific recombinase XerC